MKTLLSLTSRRFGMTHISVLFYGADNFGNVETLNDGVESIQATTRERLTGLLGDVRGRLGMVAGAVALTLSASAYGSDGQQQLTQAPDNGIPVVLAVAQSSDRVSSITVPANMTTIEKSNPNIARIKVQTAIKILGESYAIKPTTGDALEFLANLGDDLAGIVTLKDSIFDTWLVGKPDLMAGGMKVARETYLSLNKTGAPLMQNAKHFLEGADLEIRIQEALKLKERPDIMDIRGKLDVLAETDLELAELVGNHIEQRGTILVQMADEAMVHAIQRAAVADEKTKTAKRAGQAAQALLVQLKIS